MTSQAGKKWWQNSDSSDSDWGSFAISSNTNKAYQWIVSASWLCHTRMLPKGFHHLEQSTRWYKVHLKNKIILKSVILLSDIEYFKRPRVSHLLKEFGRLSGCSRDFSSSHVLAKWIHITIGTELVVYVRCVKKNSPPISHQGLLHASRSLASKQSTNMCGVESICQFVGYCK